MSGRHIESTPASPVSDGGRGLKQGFGALMIWRRVRRPSVMAGVD